MERGFDRSCTLVRIYLRPFVNGYVDTTASIPRVGRIEIDDNWYYSSRFFLRCGMYCSAENFPSAGLKSDHIFSPLDMYINWLTLSKVASATTQPNMHIVWWGDIRFVYGQPVGSKRKEY